MEGDNVNDGSTKSDTAVCLSIAKKRPQSDRPSGCAGIFRQLFDWNARIVKKKLFPNKLLSSGSEKHSSSKRFGAPDKLHPPKFHLIADENRGGFPNVDRLGGRGMGLVQHKNEMRAPSLIAKLMGLDSIPAVKKQKRTNPSHSHIRCNVDERQVHVHSRCHDDELDVVLDKGQLKKEAPSEKLLKMGQFGIRPMARFGPDSLQLRNVLSRSRKGSKAGHHAKLPTPVKSPRVRSGRNAARLINAANKILEPGLRATHSKANAISYSYFADHDLNREDVRSGTTVNQSEQSADPICYPNRVQSFEVLSPCKSCGHLNGKTGLQQVRAEQQSPFQFNVSQRAYSSPQKLQSDKLWSCRSLAEPDNDEPYVLDSNQPMFVVSQSKSSMPISSERLKERRSLGKAGQKDDSETLTQSLDAFSPQHRNINKISFDKDKIPSRPTLSSSQSRRITSAVNNTTEINSFSQSRRRIIKKVDNVRFNKEMLQSSSKSQVTSERKRRMTNGNERVENNASVTSKLGITRFGGRREEKKLNNDGAQSTTKDSNIHQQLKSAFVTKQHTSRAATTPKFSPRDKMHHHSLDSSCNGVSRRHDFSSDIITAEKPKKTMEDPSMRSFFDSFSKSSCISSSRDYYADEGTTLDLVKSVSIMLDELGHLGTTSAKKLIHSKEVILHAGLLLEYGVLSKLTEGNKFFICHFFNQLEMFANAMWSASIDLPGFKEVKDKAQLREILFDLTVEYLESRFGNNSKLGLDLQRGLPLRLTAQQLILSLNFEIVRWANLAGKALNELVEWEVSHSSGILTDYEIEACSICCELEEDLLESLVEEIVM